MAKMKIGGRTYDVEVRGDTVVVDGREIPVKVREDEGALIVRAGGVPYRVELPPEEERVSGMQISVDYRPFTVEWEGSLAPGAPTVARKPTGSTPAAGSAKRAAPSGAVTAQIAGRIVRVNVKPGDAVKAGDVLLILEAMKMENEIKAPKDGTVKEVLVSEGARVSEGDALVVIE
jgi:biotin carboxyl carrier protein